MTKKWAYMTVTQAAAKTGIGASTLRRMAASGELKNVVKLGRDYLIPISTIDRLEPRAVGRPAKP